MGIQLWNWVLIFPFVLFSWNFPNPKYRCTPIDFIEINGLQNFIMYLKSKHKFICVIIVWTASICSHRNISFDIRSKTFCTCSGILLLEKIFLGSRKSEKITAALQLKISPRLLKTCHYCARYKIKIRNSTVNSVYEFIYYNSSSDFLSRLWLGARFHSFTTFPVSSSSQSINSSFIYLFCSLLSICSP